MSVAVAQADFSSSYGNKRLSDVTLALFEEPGPDAQSLGTKRAAPEVAEELPGHGVVLISSSEYCRAALEKWADNSSDGKYRIELPVPAGQLELGKLLIKGMYYSNLDISGFTQQQLLHALLLADRYGVPKVLAAISSFLESIAPAELQWDTAMAIYNLPLGCAEGEACGGLHKAAAAKVQLELGDLELVWDYQEDQQKQQWLLDLPHIALKQLLESPLTAVNSENTVCYTIQAWHDHQLQSKQRPGKQEMKQLLKLIRMCHCSHLYVTTVLSAAQPFQQCLSCQEMGIVALLASGRWEEVQEAHHPVLKQHPAWAADRRPASKCKQEVIDWKVPVSQVRQLMDSNLGAEQKLTELLGPLRVWQGRKLQPLLNEQGSSSSRQVGSFIVLEDVAAGALYSMHIKCTAVSAQNGQRPAVNFGPSAVFRDCGNDCLGWPEFVECGSNSSWAAVLDSLRSKHLIHPAEAGISNSEEFIHIRWHISKLQ